MCLLGLGGRQEVWSNQKIESQQKCKNELPSIESILLKKDDFSLALNLSFNHFYENTKIVFSDSFNEQLMFLNPVGYIFQLSEN